MNQNEALLDKALAAVPSERQMRWQETEYYNFVHFGLNTFYGKEWGTGNFNMKKFNPKRSTPTNGCAPSRRAAAAE